MTAQPLGWLLRCYTKVISSLPVVARNVGLGVPSPSPPQDGATMQGSASPLHLVRFGVFEVDLRAGELRKNGLKVRVQEKPF